MADLEDEFARLTTSGIALARDGRRAEAIECFKKALQLDPASPSTHHNLGTALAEERQFDEAILAFQNALRLDPTYAMARRSLLLSLRSAKRKHELVEVLYEQLVSTPDDPELLLDLGSTLSDLRRYGEAAVLLKQAIRLQPHRADMHNSLGLAQLGQGRFADAEASFEAAIRCDLKFSASHNNLATVYKESGRLPEAIAQYDLAMRFDPHAPSIRWNRAIALLQAGDYERGWHEYEWRFKRPATPPRAFEQPAWKGSDLTGKRILLHCEQGLGDALQFVRYAPLVKARGGRVVLECPSPLAAVLPTCEGIDECVVEGDSLPEFDVHVPLMSLPQAMGTTLKTVPAEVPYLRADSQRLASWREKIATIGGGKLKVGIAWQGNPHHALDHFRSLPLELFRELSELPDISLFSLQRGPGTDQLDRWGSELKIAELTERVVSSADDWADTAAIIASLDLVVSVDTAYVHLAGALGIRTWILLSAAPDWRWLLARSDTPWYPSVRLFRQKELNEWDQAFRRVIAAIRSLS